LLVLAGANPRAMTQNEGDQVV